MKKTAWHKDILRTITRGRKRFVSILVITALGVITLSGLRAACVDLRKSADTFMDEQNLYDIMIQSTLGLTDEDVEALAALDGVAQAEGGYSETVYLAEETHSSVMIKSISPTGLNQPYLTAGVLPSEPDEIAVSQGYLDDTGKSIGDTVIIEEDTDTDADSDPESGSIEDTDDSDDSDIVIEIDIDTSALEEEDTPVFPGTEFTITAVVSDPADINNPDSSTAFRYTSTTDYTFFVLPEAINSEVYTAVYLTVDGAAELNCYDDSYTEAVDAVIDRIEAELKSARETARTEAVLTEAQEKIDDAEQTLADAFAQADEQIADAEQELADAREELDSGWAELEDGLSELEDAQAELDAGTETLAEEEISAREQLQEAREELESGAAELAASQAELEENAALLAENQAELDAAVEELTTAQAEAEAQIADGKAALAASRAELEATAAQLEAQLTEARTQISQIADWPEAEFDALRLAAAAGEDTDSAAAELETALDAAFSPAITALQAQMEALADSAEDAASLQEQLDAIQSLQENLPALAIGLGQTDAGLAQIAAQSEAMEQQEAEAQAEFDAAWQTLYDSQAQLTAAAAELESGRAQLESAQAELEAGQQTLDEQEEAAEAEFAAAWATIEENQLALDDALAELEDGRTELEDGEAEYADGAAQLEDGIAEYQAQRADAEAQLADAEAELEDLEAAVWYVQDRSSLSGYANIDSDSGAIESIGTAFPVVFLAVAILISLTTITRMVEEERSLIGTYKALGFTDTEIRRKYLIFALSASLAGSIPGTLGGFILLPEIVFIIFKTMYSLPVFSLSFDLLYGLLGPVLFLGGVGLATWAACRAALQQTPAVLMRPKAPKAGSRVFLEHITFIWKRLSFLNKVTARNLFRYKKRLLMTVAGILGCTALLVCGFAIKDTVTELPARQYEQVYQYDVLAVASDNEVLLELMEESEEVETYLNIRIDTITVEYNGSSESIQVFVIPDADTEALTQYITLTDTDGNAVLPDSSGILITRNVGQVLEFSAGETVNLRDLTLTQGAVTVTALVENYLGNNIYMTQSLYEEIFGEYEANGVLVNLTESCADHTAWAETLSHEDDITSATAVAQLQDEFSAAFILINMVVYIIIILAACLAFVVLFTLSTTSISERERELATIKVLGFFDREVHLYANKETMILTVLGILPGMLVGTWLGHAMTAVLNMPGLYFAVKIYPVSYLYSGGLAVLFALLVQLITNRILNHINPAEALKSIE